MVVFLVSLVVSFLAVVAAAGFLVSFLASTFLMAAAGFFTSAFLASFYSAEAFLLAASAEAFLAFSFLYSAKNLLYSSTAFLEDSHLSVLVFFLITFLLSLSAVMSL